MGSLIPILWLTHLLIAALSLPLLLRRVPPNRLYGFRVPATNADPRVWYAANAAGGRWLLLATGVSAVFSWAWLRVGHGPFATLIALGFMTVALLLAVAASFVSLRRIVP